MDSPAPGQSSPDPSSAGAVGFSVENAQRLARATRYVEGFYRNPHPGASRGPRDGGTGAWWMKAVDADIAATSGGHYGHGSAVFLSDDGSTLVLDADRPDAITVKNGTDKKLLVNSTFLAVWAQGSWWVAVPDSCSHLA